MENVEEEKEVGRTLPSLHNLHGQKHVEYIERLYLVTYFDPSSSHTTAQTIFEASEIFWPQFTLKNSFQIYVM